MKSPKTPWKLGEKRLACVSVVGFGEATRYWPLNRRGRQPNGIPPPKGDSKPFYNITTVGCLCSSTAVILVINTSCILVQDFVSPTVALRTGSHYSSARLRAYGDY